MNVICKAFTIEEFKAYVDKVDIKSWVDLKFPVVHNTSAPTQAQYKGWHSRPDWTPEQWGRNLVSYYSGLGWNGCPHLFVGYDKILVLNALNVHGTHTPSWNRISWGIETAAEFENEAFDDGVKTNLIAAVSILCNKAGFDPTDFKLGVSGIHFHKEDHGTTHQHCPGKNLIKADFVAAVANYMNENFGTDHVAPVFEASHVHIPESVSLADTTGMSMEELTSIKWVQVQLNRLGEKLVVDGSVGIKTKEAVQRFQKKMWLTADGIAGPVTRKALKIAK